MRWLPALVLLSPGCSLLLGSDSETATDAGPDASEVDAAIDAPAAPPNTTDYTKPYGCDDDTLALYHFDGDGGVNACEVPALDLLAEDPRSLPHPGFGAAADMLNEVSVYKSPEVPEVVFDDELTIEAWVKPGIQNPSDGVTLYLVTSNGEVDLNGQRHFSIMLIGENGQFALRAEMADVNCANYNVGQGGGIDDTEWHHIVVQASMDQLEVVTLDFFIDGVHQSTQMPMTEVGLCGMDTEPAHLMVGGKAAPNAANPPVGDFLHAIDEVRVSTTLRYSSL